MFFVILEEQMMNESGRASYRKELEPLTCKFLKWKRSSLQMVCCE